MSGKITFFSQNCQGLANPQKRRAIFRHVRAKNYNIVCLQDVHMQSQQESYVKAEWGYDAFFSCYNSSSRLKSKKISNDQELIQSDPTPCPQNQKGNN